MGLNSIEAVWSLCMALNTGLTGSVLYFILIASISMESVASGGSKDGGMGKEEVCRSSSGRVVPGVIMFL